MDSLIKSKINTLQMNSNLQSTLEAFSLDKDRYLVSTQVFLVSTTTIYYLRVFARYLLGIRYDWYVCWCMLMGREKLN